jgi:hypothetical protein
MNNPIDKALDLAPIPVEVTSKSIEEDDFHFARCNLVRIIDKGNEALDGIMDVANMSQHPRSYEVIATIINSLTVANKELLELSKKKKEITGESGPKTVNNNLFIGSTSELQKLLKNTNAAKD